MMSTITFFISSWDAKQTEYMNTTKYFMTGTEIRFLSETAWGISGTWLDCGMDTEHHYCLQLRALMS